MTVTDDGSVTPEALVANLGSKLEEVLRSAIPSGSKVALLGVPTKNNWGDQAIWIGERIALSRVGASIEHETDDISHDGERIRRAIDPDGTILLQGGGSLGDLYPAGAAYRAAVLKAFRTYPVVQLAQSMHFESQSEMARITDQLASHPGLTLLLRDLPSMELARSLGLDPQLCPDLAFALGSIPRPTRPIYDVVWLARARTGREAGPSKPIQLPPSVHRSDWELPHRMTARMRLERLPYLAVTHMSRLPLVPPQGLRRALVRLTPGPRFRLGVHYLAQGKVAITDRLHGHIMCVLMGIPHVVLDNRIGKVFNFVRTWTAAANNVHTADSPDQALELALELARSATG